jgi:hypothetical protein
VSEASSKHGGAWACLIAGNALLDRVLAWHALVLVTKEASRRHKSINPTQTTAREVARRSSGAQV